MYDNAVIRKQNSRAIWATAICPCCHKEFAYNKQISRRKKFCCDDCRVEYNRKPTYQKKGRQELIKDNICPRCGKTFKAHPCAKYCPDCLEWLCYNAPTVRQRWRYVNSFNIRHDCIDRDYIYKYGKPLIESTKRQSVIVFGIEYKTIKDLCKAFSISKGQYKLRMDRGYTPEEAIEEIINDGSCEMLKTYIRRLKSEQR